MPIAHHLGMKPRYAERILKKKIPVIFNLDHFYYLLENYSDREIKFKGKDFEKRKSEIIKMAFYDPDGGRAIWWKEFTIPKRNGGKRVICAPKSPLKDIQRWILDNILVKREEKLRENVHGFIRGRSIVTNAEPHVGKRIILNIDIEDFFPSIKESNVQNLFVDLGYTNYISRILAGLCTYKGFLPQGAPTSPAISNLICRRLDARLSNFCKKKGFSYTRYADDITISGNYKLPKYKDFILYIIKDEGFRISYDKLRLTGRGKPQLVTGIVTNEKLNIRRKELRLLRAILHNCKTKGVLTDERNRNIKFAERIYGKIAMINMVRPDIAKKFQEEFDSIDWEEYIEWREVQLTDSVIRPGEYFSNKRKIGRRIRECIGYIRWVDKYFSSIGLEILAEFVDPAKVKEIKILIGINNSHLDYRFKRDFEDFKKEMENKGVKLCECRVITEEKLCRQIHDRWIISSNAIYMTTSSDVVKRGQYSVIVRADDAKFPFTEYWKQSKDLIRNWGGGRYQP